MVVPASQLNFTSLLRAIERLDLSDDQRFAAAGERLANWETLMVEVETWTSIRTGAEAEAAISGRRLSVLGLSHVKRIRLRPSGHGPGIGVRGC